MGRNSRRRKAGHSKTLFLSEFDLTTAPDTETKEILVSLQTLLAERGLDIHISIINPEAQC
jgi:hypothetical protein